MVFYILLVSILDTWSAVFLYLLVVYDLQDFALLQIQLLQKLASPHLKYKDIVLHRNYKSWECVITE